LQAFAGNIRRLRSMAATRLMAVVKANAYGHGVIPIAQTALENGANALAVATIGEAEVLRQANINAPILILGYTPPHQAHDAVLLGCTCTVFESEMARALSAAAVALQREVCIHVKVDTGMARLGLPFEPHQVVAFLQEMQQLPGLSVEGLYTHFATSDSSDESFARLQLQRFEAVLAVVTAANLRPAIVHAANSGALLRFPAAHFDMVRPGLACYGLHPSAETHLPAEMQPVLSWHTEVARVRNLPAGIPISYGCTFVTPQPSRIATIPVGYADGFRRSPPWREVLIHGQRVPIVGRICMDYAMVDVTALPAVAVGDAVVILGTQGDDQITAEEVAGWLGTINYEVVSALMPRVPRLTE
jgi:alanine racemase